jgi:hypothetical protein
MQYFLAFSGDSSKAPFDPSMMVHFRKRLSDEDLRKINELIVQRGKEMLVEAVAARVDDSDEPDHQDGDGGAQLSLDSMIKPADWPEAKNWGTISIDASCTPADMTYPTDLKLLNEARNGTEKIIDDLCHQSTGFGRHRPHYNREKARFSFLTIAKQKKPRLRKIKAAVRKQLSYLQRNLESIDALIAVGQAFLPSSSTGGRSFWPAVNWHGSKPSFSKAIPEAFPIAWCTWFRSKCGQLFEEKQGQLWSLVPKSASLWRMVFHFFIASVGMLITKAVISLLRQKNTKRTMVTTQSGSALIVSTSIARIDTSA